MFRGCVGAELAILSLFASSALLMFAPLKLTFFGLRRQKLSCLNLHISITD